MMEIRVVNSSELNILHDLDVSEIGDMVYIQDGENINEKKEEWSRPKWGEKKIESIQQDIINALSNGGIMYGAFDDGAIIGLAVVRFQIEENTAQYVGLWVSKRYRRRKIATALTKKIFRSAQGHGAKEVYVSACPSRSAVNFYKSIGFEPTTDINRELFEKEPEDVHMRCLINASALGDKYCE